MTALVLAGPTGEHEHDGGARHPEQPARLAAVMEGVAALGSGYEVVRPSIAEAPIEALARVHDPAYLTALEAFCDRGGGAIDADTYARPDSWRAARRAAGAGLAALTELERRHDAVGFVPARPPGHHATAGRAMGFCLLNSIAVAAASRTARGERVLIVDWDVHHGNGTQDIFWDDPDVFYVSTHQHPLYPGTGRASEVGGPAAAGATLNFPLPPGATGDVVHAALDRRARAAMEEFAPDWVLVSCGFDAHRADPLAQLALSSGDFADLARLARELAPTGPPGSLSRGWLRRVVAGVLGGSHTRRTPRPARTWRGADLGWARARRSWRRRATSGPALSKPSGAEPARRAPLRSGAVDQDGAVGVGRAELADRAEQHAHELAVAAAAKNEEVGALGGVDQHGRRVAVHHPAIDRDVRVLGQCDVDCSVEDLADVSLGLVAVGNGYRPAQAGRPFPGHDDLERAPGQRRLAGGPAQGVGRGPRPVDTDDDPAGRLRCHGRTSFARGGSPIAGRWGTVREHTERGQEAPSSPVPGGM